MVRNPNRHLNWNSCLNVRDLGGLKTRGGSETNFGSLVRADSLDRLRADGMAKLQDYGIKTIIDLRDEGEISPERLPLPSGIERHHIALEDKGDIEFWRQWGKYNCTPFYYWAFLARAPRRLLEVFTAIADAPPGVLVFHCGSGRDRTGLIAIMLLALADVLDEEIAADYEISALNLKSIVSPKEARAIEQAESEHRTSLGTEVREIAAQLSVQSYLVDAGMTDEQVSQIRLRLAGTGVA